MVISTKQHQNWYVLIMSPGCICIIDCSACSVLQRVTVHNKDISSLCCVAAVCEGAGDATSHLVMASACKAGVVAVTVLGGSSFSMNTFKSKVRAHAQHPLARHANSICPPPSPHLITHDLLGWWSWW